MWRGLPLVLTLLPAPARAEDLDADGFQRWVEDCDDLRAGVHPGAQERCDGLDGDCDGVVPAGEEDADQDGWRRCGGDCDDDDATVRPGAAEGCDGLDTDCQGGPDLIEIDGDRDGVAPCAGDCDDRDATVLPGAPERCDQQDHDCDGVEDDGCPTPGDEPQDGGYAAHGCGWSLGFLPLVAVLPGRRGRAIAPAATLRPPARRRR
jgi:hypothetical protein